MKEANDNQDDIIKQVNTIADIQTILITRIDNVKDDVSQLSRRIDTVKEESMEEDIFILSKMEDIFNSYSELLDILSKVNDYIMSLDDYATSLDERLDIIEDMWDKLNFGKFTATAYSPFDNVSGIENDGNPNYTATGTYPDWGTFAVNPKTIPYGSKMIVIGKDFVEHGTALDTGGTMRRYNYWIDLYRDHYWETLDFGVQEVLVIWGE